MSVGAGALRQGDEVAWSQFLYVLAGTSQRTRNSSTKGRSCFLYSATARSHPQGAARVVDQG